MHSFELKNIDENNCKIITDFNFKVLNYKKIMNNNNKLCFFRELVNTDIELYARSVTI